MLAGGGSALNSAASASISVASVGGFSRRRPLSVAVQYAALVDRYETLAATDSTDAKTAEVADLLLSVDPERLDRVIQLLQGRPCARWEKLELGVSSNRTLEAIARATGRGEGEIEAQWRETGDLGDAAAWAAERDRQSTLVSEALTVDRVYETLRELSTYAGSGSQSRRVDALAGLLSDAEPREARWVVRTALETLRIGVGEGILRDAIAEAFLIGEQTEDGPLQREPAEAAVERAYQVTSDYGEVATSAREGSIEAVRDHELTPGRPIEVMLAETADSIEDALADVDEAAADAAHSTALTEVKYDGMRAQAHVVDGEATVYSRRLEAVTEQFPEVVEAVEAAAGDTDAIIEGEIVGYDPETGDPLAFQELSTRIKREEGIDAAASERPVVLHAFDLVFEDGDVLLDRPLAERLERLAALLNPDHDAIERARHVWSDDPTEVRELYEDALAAGHEGVMVKNPAAAYRPGRRVGYMLKVKPTMEPLDLVVVRAQYSEGRKSDWMGRVSLACYDPEADDFREVGRMATGYTDEELADLTATLESLVESVDGRVHELRPEVVLTVEFEEIQASPEYDSGYALRFPRFVERRPDLEPEDADTIERIEQLYERQ